MQEQRGIDGIANFSDTLSFGCCHEQSAAPPPPPIPSMGTVRVSGSVLVSGITNRVCPPRTAVVDSQQPAVE